MWTFWSFSVALKRFRKSKFSHSTECESPMLSPERFLGSINQKIENPFSKHTKYTVIFHKRRLHCSGTMQSNFSTGFSGAFPAGSPRPWNRELAEQKRWRGSGAGFAHLYSQTSKTTVQNLLGLHSALHLSGVQASKLRACQEGAFQALAGITH